MEKPILFNTEMVRAILDGRKTVTRRVVKCSHRDAAGFNIVKNGNGEIVGVMDYDDDERPYEDYTIPPYRPGDILYVRETWNRGYIDSSDAELSNEHWFEEYHKRDGSYLGAISGYVYRADFTRAEEYDLGTLNEDNTPRPMPWRPSIHMPREAARIFLRVKDVRVERLQEIDGDGLRAEGFDIPYFPNELDNQFNKYGAIFDLEQAKKSFSALWDSTIKPAAREKYGWAANPFCWVIEFERCEKLEEA